GAEDQADAEQCREAGDRHRDQWADGHRLRLVPALRLFRGVRVRALPPSGPCPPAAGLAPASAAAAGGSPGPTALTGPSDLSGGAGFGGWAGPSRPAIRRRGGKHVLIVPDASDARRGAPDPVPTPAIHPIHRPSIRIRRPITAGESRPTTPSWLITVSDHCAAGVAKPSLI